MRSVVSSDLLLSLQNRNEEVKRRKIARWIFL